MLTYKVNIIKFRIFKINKKEVGTIIKISFSKKILQVTFLAIITLIFINLSPSVTNAKESIKELPTPNKTELLENKVEPSKVDTLLEKMEKGIKLDSDLYLEEVSELPLASSENPYYRKDFPDGSFIESEIEDITEEVNKNMIKPLGIEQIGGLSELKYLRVSKTAPWGKQAFTVRVYIPLIGYGKIHQAYDWYYIGTVSGVDYRGIYRANETASQDAVAIQRLIIKAPFNISYIAKFDFRIRNGGYWTVYKS